MKKNYSPIISKTLKVIALLIIHCSVFAQPANSITADPSIVSIAQDNNSGNIISTGVIVFQFKNTATLLDATGVIPANSIRLTITFPSTCAFTSVSSIANFYVENADNQPNGVVTLQNSTIIDPQQVLDVKLNVRGTANGPGNIAINLSVIATGSGNFFVNNDNMTASFTSSAVLPVTLKSFDAGINNCVSNIKWQSDIEDNLKNYSLEYSYDGNKYVALYDINAKGNNSLYNATHISAEAKVFYRLKMVVFDGSFTYSKIIPVNVNCNKNSAIVYPNPTAQTINVNISTVNHLPTTVVLYDVVGRRILSQLLQNGSNKIDVSKIAPGIYILNFNTNTGIKNTTVVIR